MGRGAGSIWVVGGVGGVGSFSSRLLWPSCVQLSIDLCHVSIDFVALGLFGVFCLVHCWFREWWSAHIFVFMEIVLRWG